MRAILPCLLIGTLAAGSFGTVVAQTDFFLDVRVGNNNRRQYRPPRQRRDYRPYNKMQQWQRYMSDRFYQYDRWWRRQSSYYRRQTRVEHDYGRRLRDNMYRYPSWGSIQALERFLSRAYNRRQYSFDRNDYRDPYRGGGRYEDFYRYPTDRYYDNAPRRQYYGDRYYYDRYDRESNRHAYGTGHGIGDIISGSRRGDDLGVISGGLQTAGNILGLIGNERRRDEDFGRYRSYR